MSHLLTIALVTVREVLRRKLQVNLLFFGLALVGASYVVGGLTLGERYRILSDLGLTAMQLVGFLVAVFVGSNLVAGDIGAARAPPDPGEAHLPLRLPARPVPRSRHRAHPEPCGHGLRSSPCSWHRRRREPPPGRPRLPRGRGASGYPVPRRRRGGECSSQPSPPRPWPPSSRLRLRSAGQLTGEIRSLWRGPGTWIPRLIWYLLPNLSALNANEALVYRTPPPRAGLAGRLVRRSPTPAAALALAVVASSSGATSAEALGCPILASTPASTGAPPHRRVALELVSSGPGHRRPRPLRLRKLPSRRICLRRPPWQIRDNLAIRDLGSFLGPRGYRLYPEPLRRIRTFALNYRLGGLDVFGYHLANLVIHLLASLLVYTRWCGSLFRTPLVRGSTPWRDAPERRLRRGCPLRHPPPRHPGRHLRRPAPHVADDPLLPGWRSCST